MPKKHEIIVPYEELSRNELKQEELDDLQLAAEAREEAHAPYTNFDVGAVIRTRDGKVHVGWNWETIVHRGTHAEENAIGHIPKKSREAGLKRVTVVGGPSGEESEDPVTPCGICRQKLLEFFREADDTKLLCAGTRGKIIRMRLGESMPHAFFPDKIKK